MSSFCGISDIGCGGYSWLSTCLHLVLTKAQITGHTVRGFSLIKWFYSGSLRWEGTTTGFTNNSHCTTFCYGATVLVLFLICDFLTDGLSWSCSMLVWHSDVYPGLEQVTREPRLYRDLGTHCLMGELGWARGVILPWILGWRTGCCFLLTTGYQTHPGPATRTPSVTV